MPPRPVFSLADLLDTGVLWLINRTVFHPRGYALAVEVDDRGEAVGWSLMGPGDEPWQYGDEQTEQQRFAAVERLLREASEHGRMPRPSS